MSIVTDTWRQLVRRRLWPVAVLLLGALVAVPVLLAKSPAPAPAVTTPPTADTSAPAGGGLAAQPIVAMADDTSASVRRHVLGARKDPFAPAPLPKVKATPAATPSSTSVTTQLGSHISIPGSSGSSSLPSTSIGGGTVTPVGGSTGPTGGTGLTPSYPTTPSTPGTPTPAKPKLAPGTLTVRWGDASSDSLTEQNVKKLDALPDSDHPVAIYLGPGKAKNSAVFLVDATVTPEGDGRCLPSEADCQKVELRKGETEFFTVDDSTTDPSGTTTSTASQQFELRLVAVAGGDKAKASRAHSARTRRHAHASGARVTIARVVRLLHP